MSLKVAILSAKKNIDNHKKKGNICCILRIIISELNTRISPIINWPTNVSYFPPDNFFFETNFLLLDSGFIWFFPNCQNCVDSYSFHIEGEVTINCPV